MKVVIAGAGSVGRSIARELAKRNHEMTLIDREPSAMRVATVPEAEWLLADACDPGTLEDAGADDCDVVVAATGDDKVNLVVSLLAKTEFGVPRVIARVNNPRNEWMFDESWGVDVPVSTPRIMTTMVEEAVSEGELVRIARFHQTGASIYQTLLPDHAPVVDEVIRDLLWPADVALVAIVRDGTPIPADPDLVLEAGDQVLVLVGQSAEPDLDLVEQMLGSVGADASLPAAESPSEGEAVTEEGMPADDFVDSETPVEAAE